nr:ABC transporter permease [Leifsonia psychrotolerans]
MRSLLRADLVVLARSGRTLILNIAVPIVILVITNFGHGSLTFGGASFLIGMAITYGLISSSLIGYALNLSRDREIGVLQRLRVTPAPTWSIMASRIVVQLTANLVTAIIVLVFGSIIYAVTYTVGEYLLVLAVAVLGGAVFLSIGQAIVALIRSSSVVNAVGRVLYIGLILVGILGVTGILGSGFQSFAEWTPVGAVIDLFNGVLHLAAWSSADTNSLSACAAYISVFSFIGIRWFRWEAR